GEGFERHCHGSWDAPIGTNHRGFPMEFLLIEGARVALYVVVIGAAFVIPVAAITGVMAGLRGGLLDDLLMGYVDVQLSIPAILVYFIGYVYWNPSLLLLMATFGLLSWGGIARLVRSEVLQRREDGHVLVARSLGASRLYLARRHILPNVTNTLVPAAFHLLALLVLIEAGIAFLGFHDVMLYSWGSTIAEGINAEIAPQLLPRADVPAHHIWWVSTFPAIALTLTMVSLKLTGDGLRDALDPRREF
ncbi:MAG: ABC transporter permease, partial [Halobacteriota archaeon]